MVVVIGGVFLVIGAAFMALGALGLVQRGRITAVVTTTAIARFTTRFATCLAATVHPTFVATGAFTALTAFAAFWAAFHPPAYAVRFELTAPLTLANFVEAWTTAPFARYFVNTILYTTMTTALQFVLCTLAAYAFARIRFRGKQATFMGIVMCRLVPASALVVPFYLIVQALGLLDSDPVKQEAAVLALAAEHWHPGVIGIVAQKVVERFGKPSIILTRVGDYLKGSGRGGDGIDLYDTVASLSPFLLKYGGHKYACGIALAEENLVSFVNAFEESIQAPIIPRDRGHSVDAQAGVDRPACHLAQDALLCTGIVRAAAFVNQESERRCI